MLLSELLPDKPVGPVLIKGICEDSRMIQHGDLFCAIKGHHADGRDYISDAVQNGAAAIIGESPLPKLIKPLVPIYEVEGLRWRISEIASRFYGNPSEKLSVFAVTGTNGKTSFTQFMAQALRALKTKAGMIGTMGSGMPGALQEAGLTTPSAINIQRKLREFVDVGVNAVALEASSHGLVQGRLSNVNVDTAVFTNITHDHLDYHSSFEEYRKAKEKLFHIKSVRNAVINIDDDFAPLLIAKLDKAVRVVGFSLEKATDVSLLSACATVEGTALSVLIGTEVIEARLPLFGSFNVQNVLAVIAALIATGRNAVEIEAAIKRISPVPGRMEVLASAGKATIIVDYAHTPDALEKALCAVRDHFPGRLICCVFGCGGDRDKSKRYAMGQVASRFADRVFLTSDNPRSEDPNSIIKEIRAGVSGSDFYSNSDRKEAIRRAIGMALENEIVLVAGKGQEQYQELSVGRVKFSDHKVINDAISIDAISDAKGK